MTMPGGYEISTGYVKIVAQLDRTQINKTANDAGDSAATAFNKKFKDTVASSDVSSTGNKIGGDLHKGIQDGVNRKGSILSRFRKNVDQEASSAGEGAGKGFGSKLASMGPMLASAGLAVGAAVGTALVGAFTSAVEKENAQAMTAAKFGMSDAEAKTNGKLAGKLYAQNFGDSVAEVGEASALIQKLTGASGATLEGLTKQGLTLQKVFGYDLKESVAAANNIVANGLAPNAQGAFDLIAKGAQMGLDVNDDLIDSLTEYSTQWNKLGVTGPTALGLMSQAQKAGIRNTDLLNDAFKEFSLRAIDGSKSTTAAFKDLGVSTTAIPQALAAGGPKATAALDQVIKKIQAVKDPVKQNEIAVSLFGTQFEDMGPKVFNALDVVAAGTTKVGDAASAAGDKINQTTAAKFEIFKRQMSGWVSSIGGGLLNAFNGLMSNIGPAINNIKALWNGGGSAGPFGNISGIIQSVKGMGNTFKQIFSQISGAVMANKSEFATFFNFILGFSKALWSGVGPVFKALGSAITGVINILGGLIKFFTGVFTGDWKKAGDGLLQIWNGLWNGVKGILVNLGQALINITKGIWNNIKSPFISFKNWLTSTWSAMWTGAKNKVIEMGNSIRDGITSRINSAKSNISGALTSIRDKFAWVRDQATGIFKTAGDKITSFKNNAIKAFQLARDGIGTAWNAIKEKVKSPINFVIDPVYKKFREMWNTASKVIPGVGNLPPIAKFAKGGFVPGQGNKDTVPAMLTPGEGVLTKNEIAMLGGPSGFEKFRHQLQYYNDGGIVGGIKDWVGGKLKAGKDAITGLVRGSLYNPAKLLADRYIYPAINKLSNQGFANLPRQGATNLVGKALGFLKKDDKENAAPAGSAGMGYKAMMRILNSKFPDLKLISGFRPGSKTLSGNTSYHASGRAVDVAPRRDVAAFINKNYGNITKELITPFQDLNLHNGRKHTYTGAVWNQHNFAGGNAHDHWAADNSGVLPPRSTTTITNATSRREYMMTEDKIAKLGARTINIGTVTVQADDLKSAADVIKMFGDLGIQFNAN